MEPEYILGLLLAAIGAMATVIKVLDHRNLKKAEERECELEASLMAALTKNDALEDENRILSTQNARLKALLGEDDDDDTRISLVRK